MKIRLTFCCLLAGLIFGCQPSLDLSPVNSRATSTFYQTADDASAALTGAYGILQSIYDHENIMTPNAVGSDEGVPFLTGNADRRGLWSYNLVSTNGFFLRTWQAAFTGIQRSNVVIARIPAITMDEQLKKRYVAEAKFLRALHYFNLVRFFGGVPIVTTETTSLENVQVARSSREEVYDLIVADLKEAETVLPRSYPASEMGRATQGAVKGLLAKVYLTRAGTDANSASWKLAADKAKEVIESGQYDLWADYADVYALNNRGGKESVFEVLYITDLAGNTHTTYWAPRGIPIVPGNGYGTIRVTKSLWDQYDTKDKRREASFLTSYFNSVSQKSIELSVETPDPAQAIVTWKLADLTSKILGGGGKSFPYLRYSDILLIYAEALNEANNGPTQEAYAALNRVRARAGLAALSGMARDQFRDAVLRERRLEFSYEGQRWFDLSRSGKLLEAVKAETSFGRNPTIQPHHVLFPIPQREMDANSSLTQNPGY